MDVLCWLIVALVGIDLVLLVRLLRARRWARLWKESAGNWKRVACGRSRSLDPLDTYERVRGTPVPWRERERLS